MILGSTLTCYLQPESFYSKNMAASIKLNFFYFPKKEERINRWNIKLWNWMLLYGWAFVKQREKHFLPTTTINRSLHFKHLLLDWRVTFLKKQNICWFFTANPVSLERSIKMMFEVVMKHLQLHLHKLFKKKDSARKNSLLSFMQGRIFLILM